MPAKPRLTPEQVQTIIDHVTPMIEGVQSRLDGMPARDTALSGNYVKMQRLYLSHVRGALRWVIGVAKQRMENADNVNGESIRPATSNSG